ncbi:MAG: hypothetical protein AB7P04_01120 [Bacteriovoracia bacterium]
MTRSLLGILLALAVTPAAHAAKNRAILFGGNCETDETGKIDTENQFQPDMETRANALSRIQWEVIPLYDGDQGDCRPGTTSPACAGIDVSKWSSAKLAENARWAKPVPRASKEELFGQLQAVLDDSSFGRGDQLLLNIDTHGSPNYPDSSHGICLSDGKMLPTNDPELLLLFRKLKEKGVKLGFNEESCFSGASVPAWSEFGCVLTPQTADSVSWGPGPSTQALSDLSAWTGMQRVGIEKLREVDLDADGRITMEEWYLGTLKAKHRMPMQPQFSGYPEGNSAGRAAILFRGQVTNERRDYSLAPEPSAGACLDARNDLRSFSYQLEQVLADLGIPTQPATDIEAALERIALKEGRLEKLGELEESARDELKLVKFQFLLELPADLEPFGDAILKAFAHSASFSRRQSPDAPATPLAFSADGRLFADLELPETRERIVARIIKNILATDPKESATPGRSFILLKAKVGAYLEHARKRNLGRLSTADYEKVRARINELVSSRTSATALEKEIADEKAELNPLVSAARVQDFLAYRKRTDLSPREAAALKTCADFTLFTFN